MKKFYISTPIYYPSGKPHIGHAYSTILADVLSRYKSLIGFETFFVTGTDEHGKKIQDSAKKMNMTPKEYVDMNSKIFLDLWELLGIKYDRFIRTTEKAHTQAIQKIFSEYYKKDLIYINKWSGLYCVSCEENYTLSQANETPDGLFCQHGHKLSEINEESYFFKMSIFNDWIKNILLQEDFIFPKNRSKELINNFLSDSLTDLSISRTSFSWGINVLENKKHIIYVWMDALFNYITALNYLSDDDQLFRKFWQDKESEKVHILSKEITRFHCIYWPIFLKNLDLELPTKILSHGWIITDSGKMSKSLGNVIDPVALINKYGRETIRYYFIKDMSLENDNTFSLENMIGTFNGDLANNFGNLVSRSLGMLNKYNNNIIPKYNSNNKFNSIIEKLEKMNINCFSYADKMEIASLLNELQNLINVLNKEIEISKPWEMFKENKLEQINDLLYVLFKTIESISFWLQPILIDSIKQIEIQTNINISDLTYKQLNNKDSISNIKCSLSSPIFKRIINEDE